MANGDYLSTIRVFFKKQGRIKYISHLDINRCVSRALKRSGLPVWHTLGFNPHIYVTFALPLALGYESECESMDFRLTRDVPMREVVDRLNAVFPEGLTAYLAQPAGAKPEAICWADYRITLEFDGMDASDVADRFAAYCAKETIPVVKKTKKGEKTIDVKPHFTVFRVKPEGNVLELDMRTAAGTALNINPTLILDHFLQETGIRAGWTRVVRTAILDREQNPFI